MGMPRKLLSTLVVIRTGSLLREPLSLSVLGRVKKHTYEAVEGTHARGQ